MIMDLLPIRDMLFQVHYSTGVKCSFTTAATHALLMEEVGHHCHREVWACSVSSEFCPACSVWVYVTETAFS